MSSNTDYVVVASTPQPQQTFWEKYKWWIIGAAIALAVYLYFHYRAKQEPTTTVTAIGTTSGRAPLWRTPTI